MTLSDPGDALADQSNFIGYLLGLAGLARVVHELAADDNRRSDSPGDSSDFVDLLLGLASLGQSIERLADAALVQSQTTLAAQPSAATTMRWLR
jgi:hypothetical protein